MKSKTSSQVITYIILILASIYVLFPLVVIVITAMRSTADLYQGPFSLPSQFKFTDNLVRAWSVGHINKYAGNSFYISTMAIVFVLSCSILAGYSFARIRFLGKKVLFTILLMGMMVPFQAIMIPIYFQMNAFHLLNTRMAVIILLVTEGLPFGTFLMRSFMMGIPEDISESGRLDGCSEFRICFSLILPLTVPAWFSLIIFEAMWSWNNFIIPLLMVYNEELKPIPLGLLYFQGRYTSEYTVIAMAMLISLLPLLLLYILLQKRFTTGITSGALKA